MAAIGTVLGAAQTLFAALDSSVLKEVCATLGYKSHLEDLKKSVNTAKSVLLDAAASEELSHTARDYIEKIKTVVYDADDLFDESRTLAERKLQLLKKRRFLDKVVLLFSSENSIKVAYQMSKEIKKIRRNLDGIARDHTNFGFAVDSNGFAVDSKHIRNRREETCSYVNAPNVIGREADVEAIVDKLLDLNGEKGARFLSIVGIGGMGKTTLAQLVCSDQRVKNVFSLNVWWVFITDQDNHQFDKKTILCKILDLATGNQHQDFSLEEIQTKLRRELEGNQYLLVLDDLWNDDRVKWTELKDFLMLGAAGSRIMVTSRSHDVALAIGDSDIYVLEGLSDQNSWRLFEMTAFVEKSDSQVNPLEVEIGKKIVKQCFNVPLAIKVVGSLLCGQGLDKWQNFEKSGLGGIRKGDNRIISILKFSYHNLEPSLKSCFSYCALFPKDYEIRKEMLIRLWIAQGYIVPYDKCQSIVEAGEERFLILLRRCFFQDVKMDKHGKIQSFKMHDLIHDVAQEVAGQEILVATSETSNLCDKVRHVFDDRCELEENYYSRVNIKARTYFRAKHEFSVPLDRVFANGRCLRTLTLVDVGIKSLPDSVGKLLHLRYLDLSQNDELQTLPDSVTKLHNLQTLKLEGCRRLGELPKKLSRLVNLMHLNIQGCHIRYMPVGMDKLTCLCELTDFVVADERPSAEKRVGQLKDLKALVKLKGRINIDLKVDGNVDRTMVLDKEGSCLLGAVHLRVIKFSGGLRLGTEEEAVLEKLLPHHNVIELELVWYRGIKIPSWGRTDYNWSALLPNLVIIDIRYCRRLKHLPLLSRLKYLQSLTLCGLDELEYIEDTRFSSSFTLAVSGSSEAECTLFPSLESLVIKGVPKLKGWVAGIEFADSSSNSWLWLRFFPRLFKVQILCVEDIFNPDHLEPSASMPAEYLLFELRVNVDRVNYLKSLPGRRLTKIILSDQEIESLAELADVFKNCSSLRSLRLYDCSKLCHFSGGLEHLTALKSLKIRHCGKLKWEEGCDDGIPWRHLHQNLRSLKLVYVESLEVLPKAMQYLTSLQKLSIEFCDNFQALPDWISCLSSLQSLVIMDNKKIKSIPEGLRDIRSLNQLVISNCSDELETRCKEPDGEDWPKIQHIPNISI